MNRDLLIRYLRQRAEMGEDTLFLETLSRRALAAALRGHSVANPERAHAATRPTAGGAGIGAAELRVLQREAEGCTRCRLHETRSTVVFGVGDPAAELVVVGEAPGQQEDRRGLPFVGPAGKLLDLLLLSIGLPRERVYICNVLKCRPPKNRNPLPDEVACCSPYLHRQLELIAPGVLLAVGNFAAQTLLATDQSIGRLRGRVHEYRGIPLVATFHPAYLLRSRQRVRDCWHDFQLARQVLDRQ